MSAPFCNRFTCAWRPQVREFYNCRGARLLDSRFGARRRTACGSCPQQLDPRTLSTFHPRRARRILLPALLRGRRLLPRCLLGIVVSALPGSAAASLLLRFLIALPAFRIPTTPRGYGTGLPTG